MMAFKLPKERSIHSADPAWIRQLKEWCNDVVRALRVIRNLRGDEKYIRVEGSLIRFVSSIRQQFECEVVASVAGVPTVRVHSGYASIGGTGRYRMATATTDPSDAETVYEDVAITGSGWLMVRIDKATALDRTIVLDGAGPNPLNETYYERAICRVVRSATSVAIYEENPGEMTWETATLR